VQPLIVRARRNECEKCLSRKQLQVLLLIPIEVLGDKYEKLYPSDEFNKVEWKNFFNKNAKYQTLCLNCIQEKSEIEKQKAARKARNNNQSNYSSDDDDGLPKFGPVFLTAASTAIVLKWKRNASDVVRKRGGRTALAGIISDDDSDDDGTVAWAKKRLKLNAASKALAIRWLRMARSKSVGGSSSLVKNMKKRERGPAGRTKQMNKKKQFGVKQRSGKKKKQSRGALKKSRR